MSRQEIIERLDREFGVCDRHIVRINEALDSLGLDGPMSVEQYVDLSAEQIRCIDQFIFRFAKLQDAMGGKLFRYILEYLDEDVSELPMRDILNKLERFQIVPDAHEWVYIWRFRSKGPQKTDDYFGVKPPKKDPIINKKGRELGSRASIFRSIATQLS